MPMMYEYSCPVCLTNSGAVSSLPQTWMSLNVTLETGGAITEYFDKWECLQAFAAAHVPVAEPKAET